LAPGLLGPTSRVRVASTLRPSFFLSAPAMAPRMVWCCQPVAAAICATVAPSGRWSSAISWACLVPARGVGFPAGAALVGLATFALANVAVAQDPAGNLKPAKDKSTERIDGIVALIMAIGRALVAQEQPQPEYSMFFV
jgi:hypothetical protein